MSLKIKLPFWLFKALFGKQMSDVDRRSALTGTASKSTNRDLGPVEVETQISVERPPPTPWPGASPNKVNLAEIEFEERRRRPEGGTVLDPFFGAGTTGLVCQRTGRNAIGIELNPEYYDIAARRLWPEEAMQAAE